MRQNAALCGNGLKTKNLDLSKLKDIEVCQNSNPEHKYDFSARKFFRLAQTESICRLLGD